ncbi:MAG: PD-(D/E)XK nuclease family protein [Bacteroidota bacterium]
MQTFLKEISAWLISEHGSAPEDICLVFPGKRAAVYFREHLAKMTDKPLIMPCMCTISEFISQYSGLIKADDILLVSIMYHTFLESGMPYESFDEFYYWGDMLLNDFDDIDKYRIDADDLFRNLRTLKEIESAFHYLTPEQIEIIARFWNTMHSGKLSDDKDSFLKIWHILPSIYHGFRKKLAAESIAYDGMIFREVAEKFDTGAVKPSFEKLVFAGFNALNKCEKMIFDSLQKEGKAVFFWDHDNWYTKQDHHMAGFFLRDNIRHYPQVAMVTGQDHFEKYKEIRVYSATGDVSQAQLCSKILREFNKDELENTAVILGDESLLIPVLNALPENVTGYNITMGYPLKNTPVFSLAGCIIRMQKNLRNIKGDLKFYHRDVHEILSHQYIIDYPGVREFRNRIIQENRIYLIDSDFSDNKLLSAIFTAVDAAVKISGYLSNILQILYIEVMPEDDEAVNLESEYIYQLTLLLNRIDTMVLSARAEISLDIYWKVLNYQIGKLKIPFEGEPLCGLQIMGLLETRLLDFSNIIVLSVNEGSLPATSVASSFIPYNLRKGFGLQTIEHQDAIFAHAFYRLLQRAENIHLIYTSVSDFGKGEKSRFLSQLKFESPHELIEKTVSMAIETSSPEEIMIETNNEIHRILNKYYSGGEEKRQLSPSAINTFLDCSLRFYLRYIAGIEEPQEMTEDVDNAVFGNIFHHAMEELYSEFVGKLVSRDRLIKLMKDKTAIESAVNSGFGKYLFKNGKTVTEADYTGNNILIREVIKKYIAKMLGSDLDHTPFEIISLEKTWSVQFPLIINGKEESLNLYGKIDRIDMKDGITRIVDYKTGTLNRKISSIEYLADTEERSGSNAVFQSLLYSWLYKSVTGEQGKIQPAIISLRELFNGRPEFRILIKTEGRNFIPVEDFGAITAEFSEILGRILSDIFNAEAYVQAGSDKKVCEFCAFRQMCGR